MNKLEFLEQLRKGLLGLPQEDVEERLTFYGEMIDDRIEEGVLEEEAVAQIGTVEEIVAQVVAELPFVKIAKARIKPVGRLKWWEILLLILGSPIWLSLLISAIAVIFSVYVSLWSVIISLWAAFVAITATFVGCLVGGIFIACYDSVLSGIAMVSAALVAAGLAVFTFLGCKLATKGILIITKKFAVSIKNCFIKKGEE